MRTNLRTRHPRRGGRRRRHRRPGPRDLRIPDPATVADLRGSGQSVVDWNRQLITILGTPDAQPATVHPTRSFAMLQAAEYDAVVSITHGAAAVQGDRARRGRTPVRTSRPTRPRTTSSPPSTRRSAPAPTTCCAPSWRPCPTARPSRTASRSAQAAAAQIAHAARGRRRRRRRRPPFTPGTAARRLPADATEAGRPDVHRAGARSRRSCSTGGSSSARPRTPRSTAPRTRRRSPRSRTSAATPAPPAPRTRRWPASSGVRRRSGTPGTRSPSSSSRTATPSLADDDARVRGDGPGAGRHDDRDVRREVRRSRLAAGHRHPSGSPVLAATRLEPADPDGRRPVLPGRAQRAERGRGDRADGAVWGDAAGGGRSPRRPTRA